MNSPSGDAMTASKHGTYTCYVNKCPDCPREDQKAARRSYDRHARRMKAYGRWAPYADAEPVRAHVNALRAAGFGSKRIAMLAGVPYKVVSALIWGVEGMPPSRQMRPWNAERLLALNPSEEDRLPHSLVDATGTRRRLQSLQVVGWSQSELSRQSGLVRSRIGWLSSVRSRSVQAATAQLVRVLYDRLWDMAPPASTPAQKRSASIARKVAAEHGWVPPLAWDDDAIDDPEAVPYRDKPKTKSHAKLPSDEELVWLVTECRETHEAIADRFGVKPSAVRQALDRYRRAAA